MNVFIATAGSPGERADYTWVLTNKPTRADVVNLVIEKDGWADPNDPADFRTYDKLLAITIKEHKVIEN